MDDQMRFSDRWNEEAARGFPSAQAAGIALDLDDFLTEFHALRRFTTAELSPVPLLTDVAQFLIEEGLPQEAAPFLSLEREGQLLRPVVNIWPVANATPQRMARLERCYSLYSDGSGNPICIDTTQGGALIWFDHEVGLDAECWVNSSLVKFAEFLLLCMANAKSRGDLSAYAQIEPAALRDGTFWHAHLSSS